MNRWSCDDATPDVLLLTCYLRGCIQFKITRRNVQIKNTPSSPYMESLYMRIFELSKQV